MADFVPGRAVVDVAQRKRAKYMAKYATIRYGFLPFSFSSLGELEKEAVTLLKWIRNVQAHIDVIMAAFAFHNYIRSSDEEDMILTTIKPHPYYILPDELHNVCGHESYSKNVFQGSSNEMKQILNTIATSV
ncbi:hypothetical protein Tco_0699102 [Tanacetum coccineum]